MKYLLFLLTLVFFCNACKVPTPDKRYEWKAFDESERLAANVDHESARMQFKLLQPKTLDRQTIWNNIYSQLDGFSEENYEKLYPLIYEQNILDIQSAIEKENLTYENLTKWYLYRILKFETDSLKSLNAIIAINPDAVAKAKAFDKNIKNKNHPIYGMPILLKDNIGTDGMRTSGGALALEENQTRNAFIIDQIENKGGLILGKVNLSEWAYYLCTGCPLGYSAIGGQSLNPYGSGVFETGGSSAGSGIAMAANYATAAVGTETSGSILSPSSQNSLVGLKPTIGLLSRSGIIPISSTLDTPGPMTRNTTDNAILLSAMVGRDQKDQSTAKAPSKVDYIKAINTGSLDKKRLGYFKPFLEDSIYAATIEKLKTSGAIMIGLDPVETNFQYFRAFLNGDMLVDLPAYMEEYASENINHRTIEDFVNYNLEDTTLRVPYGQQLFEGMLADTMSEEQFLKIKADYLADGISFFEQPITEHKLDAIVSINNYNAGHAAMAQYPCLAVPMGYKLSGEPINLTFIARPFEEEKLLGLAAAFERDFPVRQAPASYR